MQNESHIEKTYHNPYFSEVRDTSNDVYKGQLKDDKRHGQGKMFYSDGNVYDGEWKDDLRDGFGRMISGMYFPEKDSSYNYVYEGNWKNNKRDGTGKSLQSLFLPDQNSSTYISPGSSGWCLV